MTLQLDGFWVAGCSSFQLLNFITGIPEEYQKTWDCPFNCHWLSMCGKHIVICDLFAFVLTACAPAVVTNCTSLIPTYQRGFFCSDGSIGHEFMRSTIPVRLLLSVGLLVALVTVSDKLSGTVALSGPTRLSEGGANILGHLQTAGRWSRAGHMGNNLIKQSLCQK